MITLKRKERNKKCSGHLFMIQATKMIQQYSTFRAGVSLPRGIGYVTEGREEYLGIAQGLLWEALGKKQWWEREGSRLLRQEQI